MPAHEKPDGVSKSREGTITRTFVVYDVLDQLQAEAQAYAAASVTYMGLVRRPGIASRSTGYAQWEAEFEYAVPEDDDEDPQGELPTLGTLEMDGSGGTRHVTQCISQTAYPAGKGQGLVDAKVVGWHKDGVNGADIDIPGGTITLTKKWLPQAITGSYLRGLQRLRGKTNKNPYTLAWAFRKKAYSITYDPGELRFLFHRAKTSVTRAGTGVWELTYAMADSENRANVDIGEGITIPSIRGHQYLSVVYKKKTITNPATTIEVPEMALVSTMYEEEDFFAKLGF